jgi:hypothetical protein
MDCMTISAGSVSLTLEVTTMYPWLRGGRVGLSTEVLPYASQRDTAHMQRVSESDEECDDKKTISGLDRI